MTNASLPHIHLDENAYSITAADLAKLLGKRTIEVVDEAMSLFSEGSSYTKLFNKICTPGARGLIGVMSRYPGARGIIDLSFEKDYALYLLEKYGDAASAVYDFVSDNLKEPPPIPEHENDSAKGKLFASNKTTDVRTITKYIDLNDIPDVVDAIAEEQRVKNYRNATFSLPSTLGDFGHIYVLEHVNEDRVKIGRSINPKERLALLHTQGGGHARKFIGDEVYSHKSLEQSIHGVLNSKRDVGEWFCVSFDYAVELVSAVSARFSTKSDESDFF